MHLSRANYRWNDLPRMIGLAALYFFLAAISLAFAGIKGAMLLICLPSGLALAAFLIWGKRYWPGILLGAILANLLKGFAVPDAMALGVMLTLGTLLGAWLLRQVRFDIQMPRARDFFFLFLLAGAVATGAAALGTTLLLGFNVDRALNLWFSNLLGVTLIAPLILIWRQPFWQPPWRTAWRNMFISLHAAEFCLLMILSLIAGQIVFLDLFIHTIGALPLAYLAFAFIAWAALRFGRHGVLFILGLTFIQAMLSVRNGTGYFGRDIDSGHFLNFSIYCTELVVVGMLLASAIRERNTAAATATQNETRIRRLTQLHKTLSQLSQGFMRLQNESELFPFICRTVVQYGGINMAWIGVPIPSSKLLKPVATFGQGVSYLDKMTRQHNGQFGIRDAAAVAFHHNRVVILNTQHANPDRARHKHFAAFGFRSAASFPILRSGQPYAVLSVYSDRENAFDSDATALLEEMSLDISFTFDSFEREQRRQQAELAVLNSEQRFRAFFERSMIGMATCDAHGQLLEVNDALCTMLGYPHNELLRLNLVHIAHPDDTGPSRALFDRALCGDIDEYELDVRYYRSDGDIMYAHVAVRCLRHEDGSINYFAFLVQDITESRKSAELIWRQANFDQLTGLINRNLFHDRLQLEIKKSHRTRIPLALVYIDLDRFKEVNDSLGHASGDAVLVEAARRIESCVRASDTLARIGGDEFVVILSQCPDRVPVNQIAHKIIGRLSEPFLLGEETAHITSSIGVAFYPEDATDMDSLLRYADQAMYVSKNKGRSQLNYFTRSMREDSQNRLAMINDLREALAMNQFQLYFQPIVELSTNKILKAEALLRWHHPANGLIEPTHFIHLAEETGLIFKIGDWVFREAAQWAHRWRHYRGDGLQVSVNKSPLQFMVQGIEPEIWINHLEELGVPGKHIAIEITESLLMQSDPAVMNKLLKFRDAGIQVALDDFGTGYSALSYLNKFDIDYLKIDQSFIRNVVTDPFDKALSEAIIVMAHTLGLRVIAEGVETEAQRDLLTAAGCDFAQGFLFSPPVSGRAFEALLH